MRTKMSFCHFFNDEARFVLANLAHKYRAKKKFFKGFLPKEEVK